MRLRRAALTAAVGLGAALAYGGGGCVSDGHPLGSEGKVQVIVSVDGPLFAADQFDENGVPIGARQLPYQSDVLLKLTEDDEVGHGAFVQVHIEPAERLVLGPSLDLDAEGAMHEDGSGPTCSIVEGAFRCRGDVEGFARFSVTSRSDSAGPAKIVVTYANLTSTADMVVLPAGLPPNTSSFQMIGVLNNDPVNATFAALECSIDEVPDDLGDKWPVGRIRVRESFVRASPPSNMPGVIENAPVFIESLSSEGALSRDEDCEERTTTLRVVLDAKGESERFFVCFSDLGGLVQLNVRSAEESLMPGPSARVAPEPRLLRVRLIDGVSPLEVGAIKPAIELSAFDVNLQPTDLDVDLFLDRDGSNVLGLNLATADLNASEDAPVTIPVQGLNPGTARVVVTPRLLTQPQCSSDTIQVVPAEDP